MNIRHDIDPEVVQQSVENQIAKYARLRVSRTEQAISNRESYKNDPTKWVREPDSVELVDQLYNNAVWLESNYYSTVRVIEFPQKGKRFVLVYGDIEDSAVVRGTGPFMTVEDAIKWFANGGR